MKIGEEGPGGVKAAMEGDEAASTADCWLEPDRHAAERVAVAVAAIAGAMKRRQKAE